jgi:hypothetical protein
MKFTIPLWIPTSSGSNIITVGTPCRIKISVVTMAAAKWVKQRSSQGLRARASHVITGWRIFAAEKNGSASTKIFIHPSAPPPNFHSDIKDPANY